MAVKDEIHDKNGNQYGAQMSINTVLEAWYNLMDIESSA